MENIKNFEIESKRIAYLFENLPSANFAIFALSSILFFTFKGTNEGLALYIWYMLNILLVMFRFMLFYVYKKIGISEKNLGIFYKSLFVFVILSALLWGIGIWSILPPEIEYQVLVLLLVGGMASGASASLASKLELFYSYFIILISFYIYFFLVKDSDISNAVSLSLIMYAILLLGIAKRISQSVNDNILLQFRNKDLIFQLEEKVKEANKASEAKTKFLSVMSHEIRTPLNAIIGFVKILKKDEKDSTKLKYLDTVDKSSLLLMNVINDVLDISKIESGKFTLESLKFNPKNEFESLYELFKQSSLDKGVNLINSVSLDLPSNIKSDKLRLKQIISNLLSNAIKFTGRDKNVDFIVRFNNDTSSLYIEVKDEGIGIEKESMEYILEEFMQADSSIARKHGGTGLGLSIANRLLSLFDSKLNVESEIGKGSSFSFEINVDVIDHVEEKIITEKKNDFTTKEVLIAEDNKTNQMLIEILLKEMNIKVSIANDGLEAEDMCKKHKYDLVLMDINMPNKNGIESMLAIKEYEIGNISKTPIIALTANAVSGDKEEYLKYGFDGYLAKPIDNAELAKVLKTHLL